MKKLEKKVVFITGGNSGIGKAACLGAASEVVADLVSSEHDKTPAA